MLPPPQAALLREFTDETRRGLERATSAFGAQVAEHIARQLETASSAAHTDWFREAGEAAGFDQHVTLAAVAGTDVTKPSRGCPVSRAQFGLVSERVAALDASGQLRFGRSFAEFGPLEDLYMHAEGGRAYTLEALLGRGRGVMGANELGRRVSEAIVGHDSFNAGFGPHKLKPMLARRHGGSAADYTYPRSNSPDGFLVQVLDRLEGAETETMIRYVAEGVTDRGEPIATALKVGVVDNAAFLTEVSEQIRQDARAVLSPDAQAALLRCPASQTFEARLATLSRLVSRLSPPPAGNDGSYHVRLDNGSVVLDTLQAVRTYLPHAMQLAQGE